MPTLVKWCSFLRLGASGVVVNLAVITLLMILGMSKEPAVVLAIGVSICTNFLLNRRFTFSHSKDKPMISQFIKYVVSVSVGALVNIIVALWLLQLYPDMKAQVASIIGIVVATLVNFVTMKFIVFKRKFYKTTK